MNEAVGVIMRLCRQWYANGGACVPKRRCQKSRGKKESLVNSYAVLCKF